MDKVAAARGRAMGALVMGAFGSAWLLGGVAVAGLATLAVLVMILAGSVGLVAFALWRLRRLGPAEAHPDNRRVSRRFLRINAAQWAAIAVAVVALNLLARTDLIAVVISLIVAAHFLPLARLFHRPLYYLTAAALLAVDIYALTRPVGSSEVPAMLGSGLILWVTAAIGLVESMPLVEA